MLKYHGDQRQASAGHMRNTWNTVSFAKGQETGSDVAGRLRAVPAHALAALCLPNTSNTSNTMRHDPEQLFPVPSVMEAAPFLKA